MFEKVRDRKTIDKMVEVSLDDLVRFAYYHVGNRTDAEDIVYEAILRLLEKVARDLVPDKVRGYLFRIVYNLCRDHFRHRNAPSVSFEAINLPNLPDDVLDNEEVDRVNGLLDGLLSREFRLSRLVRYFRFRNLRPSPVSIREWRNFANSISQKSHYSHEGI